MLIQEGGATESHGPGLCDLINNYTVPFDVVNLTAIQTSKPKLKQRQDIRADGIRISEVASVSSHLFQ